jgi:HAD superfamily hydrolase (TIGR01509 family)
MPKAVIFDVDGTLVDSVDLHARAWVDAFRDFGHEVGFEEVRGQIGKGGDQLMPVFLSEEEIEEKGEALEKHRGQVMKERYLPQITAFPQVRELFERLLADGKRIALASSAKEDELAKYKKVAQIEDLIDAETSSDDAEKSKPHPDIFEAAMKRLGDVRPEDVVVVGDTPYDAEAAGKAGLRTIGVLCGGFPEQSLREAGCIAIYKDPADLLAQYDRSALAEGKAIG